MIYIKQPPHHHHQHHNNNKIRYRFIFDQRSKAKHFPIYFRFIESVFHRIVRSIYLWINREQEWEWGGYFGVRICPTQMLSNEMNMFCYFVRYNMFSTPYIYTCAIYVNVWRTLQIGSYRFVWIGWSARIQVWEQTNNKNCKRNNNIWENTK